MELTLVPLCCLADRADLTVQELARLQRLHCSCHRCFAWWVFGTLLLLAVYIVVLIAEVILTVAVSELTFIMGRVKGLRIVFHCSSSSHQHSIRKARKILIIWGSVAGIIAAFAPILGGP